MYDIDYDDGERETRVAKRLIPRRAGAVGARRSGVVAPRGEECALVKNPVSRQKQEYPGKISRSTRMEPSTLAMTMAKRDASRLASSRHSMRAAIPTAEVIDSAGDKVEADYRGRGRYYPKLIGIAATIPRHRL